MYLLVELKPCVGIELCKPYKKGNGSMNTQKGGHSNGGMEQEAIIGTPAINLLTV